MYCPRDGTIVGYPVDLVTGTYSPCTACGTMWRYDESTGTLEKVTFEVPTNEQGERLVEEILSEVGADSRALGVDALVANIVDTMEKKALADGQFTYYMGTFAVARETLATVGLTCEKDSSYHGLPPDNKLRWISFFGDDWEYFTRQQAIELLLAERS